MSWMPIDTAPKDGTHILITGYFRSHDFWMRDIAAWSSAANCWEGKGIVWDSGKAKHLSHWTPIPDDPKQLIEHPQNPSA
jgi:hypothetical protein